MRVYRAAAVRSTPLSRSRRSRSARPTEMPIFSWMRLSELSTASARRVLTVLAVFCAARASCAPALSPVFSLSAEQLSHMTAALPADIQQDIRADPADFLRLMATVLDQPEEFFVLVDKRHPLESTYVPPDLVNLKEYPLKTTWPHILLRKAIMPEVLAMARAAHSDGVTLTFSSGYRSYSYQQGVFEREVQMFGREMAERESAHAGYSQHQLGTAIDFGSISDDYGGTSEGRWVAAHAGKYGFSLSYPAGYEQVTGYRHEAWHYRYITPAGTSMQRRYFRDIQQYFLQFLHDNRESLAQARVRPR